MFQLKPNIDKQIDTFDCVECGSKKSVTVRDNRGYCQTIGCLQGDLVQFVFHPDWTKPKTSRAGREIWWLSS
ncbi:hypothetical protein SAMN05444392_105100 [Seinonella peptonophila]|uniref:Uncharacterized protein n=1 Tax=Seinonella peptonophila TaxID=112248 RepID=A0A1M4XNM5_9BACL|nr:hypothetical protein [Seinonella peptonophila]SHE95197.1 hypothetical protein SAMN05444392_105100 [Seinonella peptonophila]